MKTVVTGASSDIGCAIARRMCEGTGVTVLQYNMHPEKLGELRHCAHGPVELVQADFSSPGSLAAFLTHLNDADIVINAAGVTRVDPLPALDDRDVALMVAVNISALVAICRKAIPGMVARRRGCIVNVSSVTAIRASRGQTVYAGTKGFVESFTRALAAEYGPRGIRANCVAPGPVDAGKLKDLLSLAPDEVRRSVASPRLGTPDDVAGAVGFLCSDDASFINGKVIPVDGGFMQGV